MESDFLGTSSTIVLKHAKNFELNFSILQFSDKVGGVWPEW